MTVIARKRKESKFEPVVSVKDIEHAAVDLCNRDFGVDIAIVNKHMIFIDTELS